MKAARSAAWRRIPGGVWALGTVSLFMDISSEMIHGLLPIFLVTVLGAGPMALGAIEGAAEATASVAKLFSGWLSDALGKRKPLALLGYGMAAAVKPVFPLATGVGVVFLARFLDRVGKGIRGSPRDALVGDLAPRDVRGAAFGLRQALDTVGAIIGPGIAVALMWALADDVRAVFWIAVIPAWLAVLMLAVAVREPRSSYREEERPALRWALLADLGRGFWVVIALAFTLTLARFSEAFLIVRGQELGLTLTQAPLVLVVFNIAYAVSAYPAGALSDRIGRARLIALGSFVLAAGDLVLAISDGLAPGLIGALLWGLHMGLTQGLLAALVVDSAPARLRGTAFGVFHSATALGLLAASLAAGLIWETFDSRACFLAGAVVAGMAALGFILAGLTDGMKKIKIN